MASDRPRVGRQWRPATLALACVLASSGTVHADWGFRKTITIDRTQVGVSGTSQTTLADYPLLIHITDNDLRTTANGGEVTDSAGDDITFASLDATTCGGTAACALAHEIESYSATTGELAVWVRIPSLNTRAAVSDTVIYIYYGNSAVTSPTERPTDVWDSDFTGVWHLHDDFLDSTSNNNDGTNNGSTDTTGIVQDGQDFDGSNDYVTTPSDELETADDFTISAWFNSDDMSFAHHLIWQGDGAGNGFGASGFAEQEMHISMGGYNGGGINDVVSFLLGDESTSASSDVLYAEATLTDTTNFHHVVAVVENLGTSPALELFLDGVSVTTDTGTTTRTSRANWDTNLRFGRPGASQRYFDGIADEIRISTVARDADWIATEYANIDDPGDIGSPGFYTVGSEEADPPTAVRGLTASVALLPAGVEIRWSTRVEVDNLGFHLHRQRGGRSTRLTKSWVSGTALQVGSHVTVSGGGRYSFVDLAGSRFDLYWIESIDLNGSREMHGPFHCTGVSTSSGHPLPSTRMMASRGGPTLFRRARHGASQSISSISAGPSWETPGLSSEEIQHALAAAPAIKILVDEAGWTRVAARDLFRAGLSPSCDPRLLQLYTDGLEVAITVTGANDGVLDPTDTVEFWGTGRATSFSDLRTYWLVEGTRSGHRIHVHPPPTQPVPEPSRTWAEMTIEPRENYFPSLLNGDEENFFGPVISTQSLALTIDVVNPVPNGSALASPELEVLLQGVTTGPHVVDVAWNSVVLGRVAFEGREIGSGTFFLPGPPSPGPQVLELTATHGPADFSFVNLVRLAYWREVIVEEGELSFTLGGASKAEIRGFTRPTICVVDVTDPFEVESLEPWVTSGATGQYRASIQTPSVGNRQLFAFQDSAVRAPVELARNLPSRWSSGGNAAEVIAIVPGKLWPSASRWRDHRVSEGWSIALVDLEDVFDEVSFGDKNPAALRDFLAGAHSTWSTRPTHVVLFGDASFDPRGYVSNGAADLLPTPIVATERLETASDDWYVDFDSDGFPDLAIGRIPAQNGSEAAAIVDKIIAFPKKHGPLETLLVADSNDTVFDFEQELFDLAATFPAGTPVDFVLADQSANPTQSLRTALDRGPNLVHFIGHGSRLSWGSGLFEAIDVFSLSPQPTPAVAIVMTCLTGYFHDPDEDSVSEVFLKVPGRGAIAVFSSSGMCRYRDQRVFQTSLFAALRSNPGRTLGETIRLSKETISDPDVRRTWNLLGDPLLRLR